MFVPSTRGDDISAHTNSAPSKRYISQQLPNIMWSSRCLLEAGTRMPSASAKAAVHHPPLQPWGLRGVVSRGLSTLGQHSARLKRAEDQCGAPTTSQKSTPPAKPNSHLFSHPSSHRLHAQPPRYLFFVSFASKLWGAARVSASPIHSREERWAKVSPISPGHWRASKSVLTLDNLWVQTTNE